MACRLVIVGTDRTTARGDVCNKIGTYLKALAAKDNQVPFYVALPSPSIDWLIDDGVAGIPIEQRDASEVVRISGVVFPTGQSCKSTSRRKAARWQTTLSMSRLRISSPAW